MKLKMEVVIIDSPSSRWVPSPLFGQECKLTFAPFIAVIIDLKKAHWLSGRREMQ